MKVCYCHIPSDLLVKSVREKFIEAKEKNWVPARTSSKGIFLLYSLPMSVVPEWFSSFRQRNYRRFFVGQTISLAGTFMQMAAIPWVVWELTHSPKWLGAANFFQQIPFLFVGLVGGAVADRFPRRNLLFVTQGILMAQAAGLAALAFTGQLQLAHVICLALFGGIVGATDFPTRQAFVMDLVGPVGIGNAIALNAILVHTMRILGPLLAGVVLLHAGAPLCFLINAVTYLGILIALSRIDRSRLHWHRGNPERLWPSVRAAFRIVRTTPSLRRPLLLVAIMSFAGGNYLAFLPYYADHVLGGGPDLLGILLGCSAAGALSGAVLLLTRTMELPSERWLVWAGIGVAVGLVCFAQSDRLWLAGPSLFVVGMGFLYLVSVTNTLVQLRAPAAARGRVVSYLTSAFFGFAPVGSLLAGLLASSIGVPHTLCLGAIGCLGVTAWYWRRNRDGATHTTAGG